MRSAALAVALVACLAPVRAEQKMMRATGRCDVKLAPVGNKMDIIIEGKQHKYVFEYVLPQ